MLEAGSRLAFGSDYPVENPNPFHGLAVAVSRQDAAGRPPRGWLPKEKLSMQQAFAAFTSDAGRAGFAEERIGKLLPGMAADFILVDRDIFTERDQRRVRGTQCWRRGWGPAGVGAGGSSALAARGTMRSSAPFMGRAGFQSSRSKPASRRNEVLRHISPE
jgi:cytosine/adenosine deaminase-related metal-dependent hydrolase